MSTVGATPVRGLTRSVAGSDDGHGCPVHQGCSNFDNFIDAGAVRREGKLKDRDRAESWGFEKSPSTPRRMKRSRSEL